MDRWQQAQELRQQEYLKSASTVARELKATGIESITFYYESSGDDGAVNTTCWEPEDIKITPELQRRLEAMEELVYQLLPSGWEINEGSAGDVSFNLTSGEIDINHKWLEYVESDCSTDLLLNIDESQDP